MRYPDRGGLTAPAQAKREQVRRQAAGSRFRLDEDQLRELV
ncbi:hypothetical protein FHR83_007315 [Actinoplanes campanulatus]|uniref:Uncharacterized protein n=1 Tax=Actinoplanes campanulatus TaxID=113559 RepID=A0A7W5ANY7_9ACTN|nr:hypothetical protein [Actinoplanes campanulatus]MBB3099606.1 hypothetical protein [Actinoplanes campanulatus]